MTSRFTGAILYQLSYEATDVLLLLMFFIITYFEATDVGSRSIVGSYVPVKEMSVNDI